MKRTHHCGELRGTHVGQKACLCGWVHVRRDHGGIIFIDLRDREGITQVVFDPQHNKASWELAQSLRSEFVITLDGDGQHDPDAIPAFLDAREVAGDALVIGCRDFRRMPPLRRLANELGGRAFSWAVGRRIPDNQSGYRLVDRRLMEALLESHESGFAFEVEMITTCIRGGWPMTWVPIRTIYAGEPSHIRPLSHLTGFIRVVRDARRTVRRPLP